MKSGTARLRKQERIRMSELIDKQELIKAVNTWDKFGYTETGCFVRNPDETFVTYIHLEDVMKAINGMSAVQAVPISELKNLRKEMDFVIAKSREEENVLWTCLCMLDIVIESYEDQKESAD